MPGAPKAASDVSAPTDRSWSVPRRSGSLEERLTALRDDESQARALRERAKEVSVDHVAVLAQGMEQLGSDLAVWPDADVAVHRSIMAVPPQLRSREPGTPGERVHFEAGTACSVTQQPDQTHRLTAAAAVQILDGQQLRLHAMVETTGLAPDGNGPEEQWRTARTIPAAEATTALAAVLEEMREQVDRARKAFDQRHGHTDPTVVPAE